MIYGRRNSSRTVASEFLGSNEENSWRGVFPSIRRNINKSMSSGSNRSNSMKRKMLSRSSLCLRRKEGSQRLDLEYHQFDLEVSTAAHVRKEVNQMFSSSPCFDKICQRIQKFPKFNVSRELELGEELGRGVFGVVCDIRSVRLLSSKGLVGEDSQSVDASENIHSADLSSRTMTMSSHNDACCYSFHNTDEEEGRAFIAEHCVRKNCGTPRYAIKLMCCNKDLNTQHGYQSIKDLAVEAHFLASVEHQHIIKLRGLSTIEMGHEGFAIIIDKLYDILENRIHKTWRIQDRKLKSLSGKLFKDPKGQKRMIMWQERLHCACAISSAILYLHERNIMHRDLKPDNMGFDVRGDLRLFDFGLAKEFSKAKMDSDGDNVKYNNTERGFMKPSPLYKHTSCSGTKRYMAPENFLGQPYNESIDIYSFGLILWEMLELAKPYGVMDSKAFVIKVVQKGCRPCISESIPEDLRIIMARCWLNSHKRPTAQELHQSLRGMVPSWSGHPQGPEGDKSSRRRSTFKQKRFSILAQ